jgi:hypothetical protein
VRAAVLLVDEAVGKRRAVRRGWDDAGMAPKFIDCGREQAFLMPPSLLDWVPGDHLVWTILDAVEEMDLSAFYTDYRADGHGRPAYDPRMMVALLRYAYARVATAPRAGSSAPASRMLPIG